MSIGQEAKQSFCGTGVNSQSAVVQRCNGHALILHGLHIFKSAIPFRFKGQSTSGAKGGTRPLWLTAYTYTVSQSPNTVGQAMFRTWACQPPTGPLKS